MSEVKVNKISPRTNCGTVTVGDSGDSVSVTAGVPVTVNGDLKSNALKATDGGSIISQSGTTITIGASGDTVSLADGASQSGFGATGAVSWNTTVKTSGFTAVSGEGYFVNTTGGAISVNLPAGTAGAVVGFKDYANTFDTNAMTLVRNGSDKIGGVAVDSTISTEGIAITLVFIDSTQGWLVTDSGLQSEVPGAEYISATGGTITTSGDFKIHTFTGPGTFCVSCAGNAGGSNSVEYIVVAGGGGAPEAEGTPGEYSYSSGGGGAGGFRFASPSLAPLTYPAKPLAAPAGLAVPVAPYPITVGGGGPKGQPGSSYGGNGSNSIFSTITSTGGGRGGIGGPVSNVPQGNGATGGSGGGGGARCEYSGGAGNTPPVSPAQGNNGGEGTANSFTAGGGGGGAMAVGGNGAAPPTLGQAQGGNGGVGAGLPSAFGTSGQSNGGFYYFSGGAGGGANYNQSGGNGTNSSGGLGGGAGGKSGTDNADSGTVNTGGGGGGVGGFSGNNNGGAGGSGIVIIRYKFQN